MVIEICHTTSLERYICIYMTIQPFSKAQLKLQTSRCSRLVENMLSC